MDVLFYHIQLQLWYPTSNLYICFCFSKSDDAKSTFPIISTQRIRNIRNRRRFCQTEEWRWMQFPAWNFWHEANDYKIFFFCYFMPCENMIAMIVSAFLSWCHVQFSLAEMKEATLFMNTFCSVSAARTAPNQNKTSVTRQTAMLYQLKQHFRLSYARFFVLNSTGFLLSELLKVFIFLLKKV